jgi:hypothetical protein
MGVTAPAATAERSTAAIARGSDGPGPFRRDASAGAAAERGRRLLRPAWDQRIA